MFDTLLELATNDQQNTDEEIRALASACLLSLSVAYGDTGEEIDLSFSVPVRKSNLVKITCLWYLIDEGTGTFCKHSEIDSYFFCGFTTRQDYPAPKYSKI